MQPLFIFVGLVFLYSVMIMAIMGYNRVRNGNPPPMQISASVRSRIILPRR